MLRRRVSKSYGCIPMWLSGVSNHRIHCATHETRLVAASSGAASFAFWKYLAATVARHSSAEGCRRGIAKCKLIRDRGFHLRTRKRTVALTPQLVLVDLRPVGLAV